jgi:hypothetical protein
VYYAYSRPFRGVKKICAKYTYCRKKLRELHGAMVDPIALMNQPQRDQALLAEARWLPATS